MTARKTPSRTTPVAFTFEDVETMIAGLSNRLVAYARRYELQQIDEIHSKQIETLAQAIDSMGARLTAVETKASTRARK